MMHNRCNKWIDIKHDANKINYDVWMANKTLTKQIAYKWSGRKYKWQDADHGCHVIWGMQTLIKWWTIKNWILGS